MIMDPHWNTENSGRAIAPMIALPPGRKIKTNPIRNVARSKICQYSPKYLAEKAKLVSTISESNSRSNSAIRQKIAMNPPVIANSGLLM